MRNLSPGLALALGIITAACGSASGPASPTAPFDGSASASSGATAQGARTTRVRVTGVVDKMSSFTPSPHLTLDSGVTIHAEGSTTVTRDGREASFEEIQEGDLLVALGTWGSSGQHGEFLAAAIDCTSSPSPQPSPSPAPDSEQVPDAK